MAAKTHTVTVVENCDGDRLDRWLALVVPDMSRSRAQALIADGHVIQTGKGAATDASKKVRHGQEFAITIPPPAPAVPVAQDIPLDVLFEDDHLIVIDKPVGMVVHPAAGHATGTLVNALLHHCRGSLSGIGGVTRPGIVHRLDKDTSGVMVCAKSDVAHRGLVEQFQVHSIGRAYYALVWGQPDPPSDRIVTQIGRHPKDRKRMAVLKTGGKEAITDYAVVRTVGSAAALLDCKLFTGRTHQIRVHMKHLGHGLVGDPVYGGWNLSPKIQDVVIRKKLAAYRNQALQAYFLQFDHPVNGKSLEFKKELSRQMSDLKALLKLI